MPGTLESEMAALLDDLLAGQGELLEILARKRQFLATANLDGLAAIAGQEEQLTAVLQECLHRRQRLLARAADEGRPADSIRSLTNILPASERDRLRPQVEMAGARARLLQHHGLVNWVIVQRTLIHLSQLLEIIATGGRLQPTYGEGGRVPASGALVDHAA